MKQKSLKKPTDRLLATVTVALTIVGLAMLSSASAVVSYERFGTNNYYFFRQLIFAAAGLALMYMVSQIDYHFWRRWCWCHRSGWPPAQLAAGSRSVHFLFSRPSLPSWS